MPIDAYTDALKPGFRMMSDRSFTPAGSSLPPATTAHPTLFDKCDQFFAEDGLFAQVKAADLYPYFRPIEKNDGTRAIMQGREIIMAGSNNYLGLLSDARVKKAAEEAIQQYGSGCTGSRFLNGTLDLHIQLEERLAEFMGAEACVLFSTGYMTNQGVIESLARKGDIVFSDKDNHACIVAGTKVSMAETVRFKHDDMAHLRRLLEKATLERPEAGKFIVTDGVFSMSGAIAKVPELVALAEEFGAALMLDDAHAVGVIGPSGRGSAAHFGLSDRVHLTTGTFSKSFASLGGFVVGDKKVIEYIRHTASAHIFSASMPPSAIATVLKCLEILIQEPERLDRLWEISDYMRDRFKALGFDVLKSQAPIIPVVATTMRTCLEMWHDLLDEGVFVNAVIPPAVPQGQSLLRTSYMATHTNEDLDFILEAFRRVGLKHGIISTADAAAYL
jgi:8-amino-7-oxononanoate synthase